MRSVLPQHAARRPGAVRKVVWHVVKQALNSVRSLQAAQLAEFGGGQPPGVGVVLHPKFSRRDVACVVAGLCPAITGQSPVTTRQGHLKVAGPDNDWE